ncbi:MAG TPA: hypothetical protein VF148_17245 [Acidimicrobiia bacterium]
MGRLRETIVVPGSPPDVFDFITGQSRVAEWTTMSNTSRWSVMDLSVWVHVFVSID